MNSSLDTAALAKFAGLDSLASQTAVCTHAHTYRNLLGFLPHRVESRLNFTGGLDSQMLNLQERMRNHAMTTPHIDAKTIQLMLFGMLLMDGNDAAETHAIASRGLPAANRGADILVRVAGRESRAAGADDAA